MSPRRTNRSELDDLTTAQRTAVTEGAVALDNLTGRASFNAWMQVARGIVPLCTLADKPGRSRNARRSLFKEAGYGSLSPSNVSRLLYMGRLESQIAIWRTGLTPRQRDTWNSPATICKRCPEVRKAIEEANKNKPPRQARPPRPAVDPSDELERAVNHVFDLLNAVEDIDLRRQQIERLTTLLSELSEPEELEPETEQPKARKSRQAKTPLPVKEKAKGTSALVWTVDGSFNEADYGKGKYQVGLGRTMFGGGKTSKYYTAEFKLDREARPPKNLNDADWTAWREANILELGTFKTIEKAKAVCEKDKLTRPIP